MKSNKFFSFMIENHTPFLHPLHPSCLPPRRHPRHGVLVATHHPSKLTKNQNNNYLLKNIIFLIFFFEENKLLIGVMVVLMKCTTSSTTNRQHQPALEDPSFSFMGRALFTLIVLPNNSDSFCGEMKIVINYRVYNF